MKLNAAIKIDASQTDAMFENKEGNGVRVELKNGEVTPFDSFVDVMEQAARDMGTTPEEMVKRLGEVRLSIPAVVDTIVANRVGTVIGLIVTENEEKTIFSEKSAEEPRLDFLVSREMVVSVKEKVDSEGQVVLVPDLEEIRDRVRYLLENGAGALVISLKNSRCNPANEKMVKQVIESDYPRHYLGAVPVFISSDFGSEKDDFVRTTECLLNVYCWAGVDDAIGRIETYLRERRFVGTFLIADASGGAVSRAALVPLRTSESMASRR